jgi:hypothetical protein
MAYQFNGATHVIRKDECLITGYPHTEFLRFRWPSGPGAGGVMCGLFETSTNDGFRIEGRANGTIRFTGKAGGAASGTETSTAVADTNWHTAIGVATSAASRTCYLDNGGAVTNTTSLTPGTLVKTIIGAIETGSTLGANIYNYEIAEFAMWDVADLTTEERAALNLGVSPAMIRPQSLKCYAPIIRGLQDLAKDASIFTLADAAVVEHPPVIARARSRAITVFSPVVNPTLWLALMTNSGSRLSTNSGLILRP